MLESKEGFSLLAVQLHTGRSHQIRVQLATSTHPIYGDKKYGERVNQRGQQIALWLNAVSFEHPVWKAPITVESVPSANFPWNLWRVFQKKDL